MYLKAGALIAVGGIALSVFSSVSGAPGMTAERLLEVGQIDADEREVLAGGEIVLMDPSAEVSEALTRSNLPVGMYIALDASLADIVAALRDPAIVSVHGTGIVSRVIPEGGPFPEVRFGAEDRKEVARIKDFSGGNDVNMSAAEVARFAELDIAEPFDEADLREFSDAYKALLVARYEKYRERGLAGIDDYQRGKGKVQSPSEHLRVLAEALDGWFAEYYEFFDLVPDDPVRHANYEDDQFLLIRKTTQDRPTYVLVHRYAEIEDEYALILHREYFVGHTYDALQVGFIAVPFDGRTLVLMGTDVFTDKVDVGMASKLAQTVGKKRVKTAIEPILVNLKSAVEN